MLAVLILITLFVQNRNHSAIHSGHLKCQILEKVIPENLAENLSLLFKPLGKMLLYTT